MNAQFNVYNFTLVALSIIAIVIMIYAWQRRRTPGALPLSALALGMSIWLIGYAFELGSVDLPLAMIWVRFEYIGIVSAPLAWFWFATEYASGAVWQNRRRLALMALMPLLTLGIAWTNERHSLLWKRIVLDTSGPFTIFTATYGPWFWAHTAFSYFCLLGGTIILIQAILRLSNVFRGQAGAMLLGVIAPLIGNILYLSGTSPWGKLDLTPVGLTFSLVTISWSILGFRLFEIVPVARDMVLQSMTDGVLVLDNQGVIVDVNHAAQDLIGIPLGQIVGKPAREVLRAWGELLEHYRNVTEIIDIFSIGEGPQRRWYDVRVSPLHDQQNRLQGRLFVWRDVTDQRHAQEEIRLKNEELLMAQGALVHARDAAEAGSRAKSAFLAHMSHEFRTPLSAILGYCQILQMGVGEQSLEATKADLQMISVAGNHLLGLIENVLDISKIEAGRTDLMLATFDLGNLINDVTTTVQPLVERHNNRLHVECAPNLGVMRADLVKVRQILLNLLSNAAKFTNRGDITLTVHQEQGETAPWCIFRIRDTGPGIATEWLQQLFTPFSNANDPVVYAQKGAGLGLAISRHFAQLMGGDITVISVPGQGTTFTVRLPAVVANGKTGLET